MLSSMLVHRQCSHLQSDCCLVTGEVHMQIERTGFGSSVRLINAAAITVLRSCGLHEAVRDTVLADSSPAARWNLVPCEENWFSLRPASDEAEVRASCRSMCQS